MAETQRTPDAMIMPLLCQNDVVTPLRRNDVVIIVSCVLWYRGQVCSPQYSDVVKSHYNDVIMGAMASQITSLTIVYSTIYSGADQRKHQSSASLAFVRRIHWWPVNSPHKEPITPKNVPIRWRRHVRSAATRNIVPRLIQANNQRKPSSKLVVMGIHR